MNMHEKITQAFEALTTAKAALEKAQTEHNLAEANYEASVRALLESPMEALDVFRTFFEYSRLGPTEKSILTKVPPNENKPVENKKPSDKPKTLGAAIELWFPAYPKVVTTGEMLEILKKNGWKFDPSYKSSPRQLVNHYMWTRHQTFKRVASATYQRRNR